MPFTTGFSLKPSLPQSCLNTLSSQSHSHSSSSHVQSISSSAIKLLHNRFLLLPCSRHNSHTLPFAIQSLLYVRAISEYPVYTCSTCLPCSTSFAVTLMPNCHACLHCFLHIIFTLCPSHLQVPCFTSIQPLYNPLSLLLHSHYNSQHTSSLL